MKAEARKFSSEYEARMNDYAPKVEQPAIAPQKLEEIDPAQFAEPKRSLFIRYRREAGLPDYPPPQTEVAD